MADPDTTIEDQDDELFTDQPDDSPVIRQLREKARADRKARTAAEAEADRVKQESAKQARERQLNDGIEKLGIAEVDRQKFRDLVEKLVDGEPTEDAMRKLAEDYNFQPGVDAGAADEAARMAAANGMQQGGQVVVQGTDAEHRRAIGEFRDKALNAPLSALASEQAAFLSYLQQHGDPSFAQVTDGGRLSPI